MSLFTVHLLRSLQTLITLITILRKLVVVTKELIKRRINKMTNQVELFKGVVGTIKVHVNEKGK